MTRRPHQDEPAEDCWCTPTVIPVECDDGTIGWVVAHRHPDQTPEQEADRAVCIAEAIEAVKRESPA